MSAGVRAVAQCTCRAAAMINYAAGCGFSLRKAGDGGGRFCERAPRRAADTPLFSQATAPYRSADAARAFTGPNPGLEKPDTSNGATVARAKCTASAAEKTHRASHLQQRTSSSPKRSTQARPRRATPWLSQSKQGGGAPPAASLYYSLYVKAPTPSRCRGDHFAKHDGPNSG